MEQTQAVHEALNTLTCKEVRIALAYLVTNEHINQVAEAIMYARGGLR